MAQDIKLKVFKEAKPEHKDTQHKINCFIKDKDVFSISVAIGKDNHHYIYVFYRQE